LTLIPNGYIQLVLANQVKLKKSTEQDYKNQFCPSATDMLYETDATTVTLPLKESTRQGCVCVLPVEPPVGASPPARSSAVHARHHARPPTNPRTPGPYELHRPLQVARPVEDVSLRPASWNRCSHVSSYLITHPSVTDPAGGLVGLQPPPPTHPPPTHPTPHQLPAGQRSSSSITYKILLLTRGRTRCSTLPII
jgi:hypothetical protein